MGRSGDGQRPGNLFGCGGKTKLADGLAAYRDRRFCGTGQNEEAQNSEEQRLEKQRLEKQRLEKQNVEAQDQDGTASFSEFLELYRWFAGSETYKETLQHLMDAAFFVYEKQGISHAVAKALYGEILNGSVTRLEQYAACATVISSNMVWNFWNASVMNWLSLTSERCSTNPLICVSARQKKEAMTGTP